MKGKVLKHIVAYVVRLGHTFKTDSVFIESLIQEGKLENVAVLVNGDDLNDKTYGYGGRGRRYSNYGYSGYGYINSDSKKNK